MNFWNIRRTTIRYHWNSKRQSDRFDKVICNLSLAGVSFLVPHINPMSLRAVDASAKRQRSQTKIVSSIRRGEDSSAVFSLVHSASSDSTQLNSTGQLSRIGRYEEGFSYTPAFSASDWCGDLECRVGCRVQRSCWQPAATCLRQNLVVRCRSLARSSPTSKTSRSAHVSFRDGKEPKILSSCSVPVLHRWSWTDVSVIAICYGLTVGLIDC